MKILRVLILTICAIFGNNVFAEFTANKLHRNLQSSDVTDLMSSAAWINGWYTGYLMSSKNLSYLNKNGLVELICLPDDGAPGDLKVAFEEYMRSSPSDANYPAGWVMMRVAKQLYPCP